MAKRKTPPRRPPAERSSQTLTGRAGRVAAWLGAQRRLGAGALLICTAAAFAAWITLAALPLEGQRQTVLHWLGGGAYLLAAVAALTGAAIVSERVRSSVRTDRRVLRQSVGAGLAALALWGIAGAFTTSASLGGVSLAEYGAGGRVGGWFDAPLGWLLIVASLIGAFALVMPSQAQALMQASGRAGEQAARAMGRELRARGPGALAAAARAGGRGLLGLARWMWAALTWSGRDLWAAVAVLAEQRRASRQSVPASPLPPPRPQSSAAKSESLPPTAATRSVPPVAATRSAPPVAAWPPMETTAAETPLVEAAAVPPAPSPPAPSPPAPAQPVDAPPSTLRTLERTAADGWRLPPIELLDADPAATLRSGATEQAQIIVETLASFGVDARVTQINEGPSITQFGVEPGWEVKTRQVAVKDKAGGAVLDERGRPLMRAEEVSRTRVRVNRITRLADDLALALAAPSIRIEAPVPGQPIVGVEVPNAETRIVALRGLIESEAFRKMADAGGLPIALGRDVTGNPVVADLTRMPHVLIAGATGSGKSVCINTIISSLLMQKSPEEVRLILVDPKRVELTGYGAAPHLAFSHVVTEPDEVVSVLGVVVAEMDRRYRRLEECRARNIVAYNALPATEKRLPYWVVVLDELADMMMAAAAEVEGQLVRLAQLARAVGIHLVVATQRPSVDVVTGLIKANFPTRIAFATTSQTDARVIMDRAGAEKLMGRGDMLFMSSDTIKPRRVQGAYVSDAEIERMLESWTAPSQTESERSSLDEALEEMAEESPAAVVEVEARAAQADLRRLTSTLETALEADGSEADAPEAEPDIVVEPPPEQRPELDTRLSEAAELARDYERVSASLLQRRMRVGRPRAERLIAQLEQTGVIEAADGARSRRVLARSK